MLRLLASLLLLQGLLLELLGRATSLSINWSCSLNIIILSNFKVVGESVPCGFDLGAEVDVVLLVQTQKLALTLRIDRVIVPEDYHIMFRCVVYGNELLLWSSTHPI